MDSSRLAHPLPSEECADLNFPVLSMYPRSPDIDNWVSSQTCCSDDFQGSSSPVEGHSTSSAVVQSQSSDGVNPTAYMRLAWESSNKASNSCPHSPREYGFPESSCSHSTILLSCPPSWLGLQPKLEDEATENPQVPLSSSPPEFTSSSPTSDISSELGEEEVSSSLTSASSGSALSDTASISASQNFDRGPRMDQFSRRLHELLLSVLRARELDRSRTRDEKTDCTTCTSRSDDSGSSDTGVENSENDDWQDILAKTGTSTSPSGTVVHSSVIRKSNDILSRSASEMSPIRFKLPGQGTFRVFADAATGTAEEYRIVKRSHSFIQDDQFQDTLMPHTKRHKIQGEHSTHACDRHFASRTASLRRADSLKSVQTFGDGETPIQAGCIPTVPATPILTPPQEARRKAAASPRPLRNPVPIIAPPLDHVPKLPLSSETLAKIRLGKFLEREGRGREKDRLEVRGWERPPSWVGSDDDDDEEEFGVQGEKLIDWEMALGIGKCAREEVIDWILDVMPAPPPMNYISELSATSSTSGSSSSSSSGTSIDSQPSDLMDQLKNSPETRFHAAWMFLRYIYLTMSPKLSMGPKSISRNLSRQSSLNSNISASTDQEGRDLIIWDLAVACLALSVKFHRDFLGPLLPVYVHEYISLAPQRLSYEDLETAQRDLLSAFDYSLGVTPQPVMDELWFSLGSLRSLLDFKDGWQVAMADAWCGLFDAICEPDVQRFSISTLAVVALMDGVVESLVQRYLYEAALKIKAAAVSIFNRPSPSTRENRRRRRRGGSVGFKYELELVASSHMEVGKNLKGLNRNRKKYLRKAERASEGVRCDIQALVGITDAQLRDCRDWFSGLH